MRSAASTPFAAVFQTEVLFNLKRVAPYALMVLFSVNAVLWWGWGPAVMRGWAVNSDFYIVWLFGGFSFMTMPLFIALMMGDPVIRDFRIGIDPLIFSKPVSRFDYLLGKFLGNFFVLVCCQACFALTPLLLQAFGTKGMIVLPLRVLPYFQHFFFFIVISSLALAAVFFTIGTLTRNVKIVYGLAVSFYPLYIAWQFTMKGLPQRWRIALDPLLFNVGGDITHGRSADWVNHLVINYDGDMVANRLLMIGVSLGCLAILYARFSIVAGGGKTDAQDKTSILELTAAPERINQITKVSGAAHDRQVVEADAGKRIALPNVNVITQGWRAIFGQFMAALEVEFRLLRAERSLVVVAPLIMILCGLELAAFRVVPEVSYSATYASRTVNALLLFLFGTAVFYAGETMHRDRELKVEPLLWSTPAPSFVLLLSKFASTLLLSISLIALVAMAAMGLQIYKGHAPLEPLTYLKTYAMILVPGVIFMCAASIALNALLRDKYLTYAVSLGIGGMIYYLAGQGYNTWLYNPVLYNLWTPSDLVNGGGVHLTRILFHGIYCSALSFFLLALASLFCERESTGWLKGRGLPGGKGWTILIAAVSALIAVITGLIVNNAG